jgi:hypothetical protein
MEHVKAILNIPVVLYDGWNQHWRRYEIGKGVEEWGWCSNRSCRPDDSITVDTNGCITIDTCDTLGDVDKQEKKTKRLQ